MTLSPAASRRYVPGEGDTRLGERLLPRTGKLVPSCFARSPFQHDADERRISIHVFVHARHHCYHYPTAAAALSFGISLFDSLRNCTRIEAIAPSLIRLLRVMENWWTPFFSGNWLNVQRTMWSRETTKAEATEIRERLGLEPGMKLLDVPVGAGRIALELAAEGLEVTGIDQSPELLSDAARAAAERGLAMELRQSDMRDIPWEGRFDAVLNWWGSFGYLGDEGDAEFVRAVHRALKPGGRFMIGNTHIAETLYPIFQRRGWSEVEGTLIVEERTMDIELGRINAEWRIFSNGGAPEVHFSSIRLYTFRELKKILHDAGFAEVSAYSKAGEVFEFGDKRLSMVAIKEG